jgi:Phage protein (N4 Gp49/phage Sf6 gene 66) family
MSNHRVTQEEIDALLDASETQEHTFWEKELIVSYRLPCGFTVSGHAACVDPANFDLKIGQAIAREDAANQLWKLEGYRKQLEMAKTEDA